MRTDVPYRGSSRAWIGWACLALVLLVTGFTWRWSADEPWDKLVTADRIDPNLPAPELTPEEVVWLQVTSIRESRLRPQDLVPCYSLTSPATRAAFGSFDHFASLIATAPYSEIALSRDFQVQNAEIKNNLAIVPVTLLSNDDHAHEFRFLLTKQRELPYRECWMTESFMLDDSDPITLVIMP